MQNVDVLKEDAKDAIFIALYCDCGECHKDARDAVKAWARAAEISAAEAWLTIIKENMDHAQRVINDTRTDAYADGLRDGQKMREAEVITLKVEADFSDYEAELKRHFEKLEGPFR